MEISRANQHKFLREHPGWQGFGSPPNAAMQIEKSDLIVFSYSNFYNLCYFIHYLARDIRVLSIKSSKLVLPNISIFVNKYKQGVVGKIVEAFPVYQIKCKVN